MTTSDNAAGKTVQPPATGSTREIILATAERLFAEQGVYNVSNRQISEAAGQGNNAAVHYHFGTKHDLITALVERHQDALARRRAYHVAQVGDDPKLRDWVACVVLPVTDHLAELGRPTWFARFNAQLVTDPMLHPILDRRFRADPAMATAVQELHRCVAHLPPEVCAERSDITKHLMMHMVADRERALAKGTPTPRDTWSDAATGLVDAIVGVWQAPVS
ncbi:AcrR family transcriptional regulator [Prauserella sediminis]|uniref:AcrR family transcriptional regulator n=1 Tax=Prauserella sediminis TaxID=577680 RepID=A0A839XN18_9PSEU|nr:TetR/AcrR family transcriptional regulator [Prauserella sediminis]MBB3662208.1 AcrR family transcriptional regulator [Prauserella sediminis]